MNLSILVAKTNKDKHYVDLLLPSIEKTIGLNKDEYEIIVHDNSDTVDQLSYAHAKGLTNGYKKTNAEIVLILDSDTYFFSIDKARSPNGWGKELLANFEDDDVVFCSAIRCTGYEMSFFYRSHFLAIRDSFYRDLIINKNGFFPESNNGTMINDMSHKITKACIDNNKKFIHYKNSCDDDLKQFYRISGETVYNKDGVPFFHHMGRGSSKPNRLLDWLDFWKDHEK